MVKVQILTTPGCAGCALVEKILDKYKIKYQVIDVTKNQKILEKYPILSAPGVVIDNKLEFTGVPSEKKLIEKIKSR